MNRLFSMTRRRPNLVDLMIPRIANVDGYRIETATSFNGSWTTRITAPVAGYVDPAVNIASGVAQNLAIGPNGPPVRIVFNPATYGLTDTLSFWMRFVPVAGGTPGTAGAPTLVLPDAANHGLGIVTIRGTAPVGADSTASLQLDLPRLMSDLRVNNEDGTNPLFIAMEQDGAETRVAGGQASQFISLQATQGSLWVRATGGTVTFSATMTASFPR